MTSNERTELNNFLKTLEESKTPMLELPGDQQDLYFRLTKGSIFPTFFDLADRTAVLGKDGPIFGEPRFKSVDMSMDLPGGKYLSVSLHVNNEPEKLKVKGQEVGQERANLYISDSVNSMSIHLGTNGEVTFGNDNMDNTEILLDSAQAMFDQTPSHKMYPAGNPAIWISRLIENNVIELLAQKLEPTA
jgi:hypothetical protein